MPLFAPMGSAPKTPPHDPEPLQAQPRPRRHARWGVSLLAACGGGGSNDGSGPPPAAAPTTVDVATAVIDGAILNATVCLDKNDNGVCDEGEYATKTAADGTVTLKIAPADKDKYTLLAVVSADAVDVAIGQPVGTAYAMRTPADQPTLITPLTTLVKAQMDLAGQASTDAAQALQDAAGLALPMFADFSKGSDDLARASAAIARLVVLAKQGASIALKDAVGQEDANKVPATALDVDRVVNGRLLDLLASIITAGTADAVATATGSARDDALKAAAQGLVANELWLSAAALSLIVGNSKKPDAAPAVAGAGANLAWSTYTSASDWYFRYFASTAAQNVPDAKGRAESLYCGAYQSRSVRAVRDVAGLNIADVVKEIRAYPLASMQGAYPEWGPNPALLKAGATFPANSCTTRRPPSAPTSPATSSCRQRSSPWWPRTRQALRLRPGPERRPVRRLVERQHPEHRHGRRAGAGEQLLPVEPSDPRRFRQRQRRRFLQLRAARLR